ncbi:leucyl aminopeptidase family protein [Amycolatopsis sp. H20-H5]|uniref:leucyl aminopeptidase family protein n=1 Tax=Amycolatopsis sp. H20-H5 TaxID=3046309 RepID=UPI002DBCE9D3|nr:M17 family metallopeptidase [Amycolatopsis sp. H20-H5]MEC3979725.1 M17 family metallopeptidase [Amycolatopsis sp. H20-H5]
MRNPLPPVPSKLLDVDVSTEFRRGAPTAVLVAAPEDDTELPEFGGVRATGKASDVQTVPGGKPQWIVGVGDGEPARYRAAGAALIRAAGSALVAETESGAKPSRSIQVELPAEATAEQIEELTFGLLLGGYSYTVTAEDAKPELRSVRLVTPHERAVPAYTDVVTRVGELAAAAAFARDLANTPSNVKDPAWLANTAAKVAGAVAGLSVTIRDENWLAEQGFGGVLAVGGGSASPPRLIELEYSPRGASAHLLFVGKGITFDTGGLSIKPADGMHLMRTDMAGGGAVIAAVRAIAALKLPVRVTGLVPAAENHVSGSAYRPGDIVRHYGGKTSEVSNTDAEGRMVLADALVYGLKRFKPDAVVDVATLTGAMKISLGVRTGGFFATDDALAERVRKAGERVGEAWWRMPLLEDMAADVHGELGDVRQTPGGPGGIAAALFLREFVAEAKWAHLDIAGPARADKTYADVVPGATGFAARTLVALAESFVAGS